MAAGQSDTSLRVKAVILIVFTPLALGLRIDITPTKYNSETSCGGVKIGCVVGNSDKCDDNAIMTLTLRKEGGRQLAFVQQPSIIDLDFDAPTKNHVQGHVDRNYRGFLNVFFPNPEKDDAGMYSCVTYCRYNEGVAEKDQVSENLTVDVPSGLPFQKVYSASSGEEFLYYTPGNELNYYGARDHCYALGAYLLHFDSVGEHDAVKSFLANQKTHIDLVQLFVGAYQLDNEGAWVSEKDGTPLDPSKWLWKPGQPDNGQGNEHCVTMYASTALLNDHQCFTAQPFICEKTPKPGPASTP